MNSKIMCAVLVAGTLLLSACAHKKKDLIDEPVAGSEIGSTASTTGASASASTSGSALDGDSSGSSKDGSFSADASGPLGRKIIYFDFDKSEIKPEFADVIAAHAKNLTDHPNLKLKLEGNTDERGTREYNIGLGERRAQAVRRALTLQGVAATQVTTTSFGAERPAVEGDDESAWTQNRRVELVYQP